MGNLLYGSTCFDSKKNHLKWLVQDFPFHHRDKKSTQGRLTYSSCRLKLNSDNWGMLWQNSRMSNFRSTQESELTFNSNRLKSQLHSAHTKEGNCKEKAYLGPPTGRYGRGLGTGSKITGDFSTIHDTRISKFRVRYVNSSNTIHQGYLLWNFTYNSPFSLLYTRATLASLFTSISLHLIKIISLSEPLFEKHSRTAVRGIHLKSPTAHSEVSHRALCIQALRYK